VRAQTPSSSSTAAPGTLSKRDKSYQIVMQGAKAHAVELSDGYALLYGSEWEERLMEFVRLERKYHAARQNTEWIYELVLQGDNITFRVRGTYDIKTYIAGLLKSVGKA
jgi:hypothetical protein